METILGIADGLETYHVFTTRYVVVFTENRIIFVETGNLKKIQSMSLDQILTSKWKKIVIPRSESNAFTFIQRPWPFRNRITLLREQREYRFSVKQKQFQRFQQLFSPSR